MLKNYFKTAWRNISRNKVFSVLNILGLAIGMGVALLIGLWINDQYSYDRWLPNYWQAYQVKFNLNDNGVIRTQKDVCRPLEDELKNDVRGVAYTSPAYGPFPNTLTVGNKKIHLRNLVAGDGFLQIFRFPMLEGNRSTAMKDPNSIVLTESTARALFGNENAMNKMVRIYDPINFNPDYSNVDLKVTAVLKDLPHNSTLQFDYLTPLSLLVSGAWAKAADSNWDQSYFEMYIGLQANADPVQVEADARMLVKKYAPSTYRTFHQQVLLQPMKDWHLRSEFQNGKAVGGLIDYMKLFSIIGILVMMIACINFINLSTARSQKRAREVGVRKVIGSTRKGLILQFLIESVVLTSIGFILSLIFVQLALPSFNTLVRSDIAIPFSNIHFWMMMTGYVLFTGLLAGSKPAFYLSSFQPARVLKAVLQTGRSGAFSRKALLVLQFTCSIGLIISTVIIYRQIQYARNRPTGYDPNRLLESPAGSGDYIALKHAALASGMVSSMTKSLSGVTEVRSRNTISDWQGKLPNEPLTLAMNAVSDPDYFETLGEKFVRGRNFTGNYSSDSSCTILNEAAIKRMRLKEPVGSFITWTGPDGSLVRLRVIGVVKDALTDAPFSPVEPSFFLYQPGWTYTYIYRLAPTVNTQTALAGLKPIFEKYDPSLSYMYRFVDEDYAGKFEIEMLIGKLAGIFTVLAVFTCCLGLFGLAAFLAEQRTKEIGIRKVLGASISEVFLLLTRDFIILVFISCMLASPIAFYFMQNWLQQYYYRIDIGPGVFIASAMLAILIALLTISFQSVKAATANPVTSLRSE
jgi:putative ABC transport system permease protein